MDTSFDPFFKILGYLANDVLSWHYSLHLHCFLMISSILISFCQFQLTDGQRVWQMNGWTNGWTNWKIGQPTNRWTNKASYRHAQRHLEICNILKMLWGGRPEAGGLRCERYEVQDLRLEVYGLLSIGLRSVIWGLSFAYDYEAQGMRLGTWVLREKVWGLGPSTSELK